MKSRRRHSRAKLDINCHVFGKDGKDYPALLEDISFSGASVIVSTDIHFKIGDLCDLKLKLKSAELPMKRPCEIIRLDNKIIGVKFIR